MAESVRTALANLASDLSRIVWDDVLYIECAFIIKRPDDYEVSAAVAAPLPLDTPLDRLVIYRRIPLLVENPSLTCTCQAEQTASRAYRSMFAQLICHETPFVHDVWLVEYQRPQRQGTLPHQVLVMLGRPRGSNIPPADGMLRSMKLDDRRAAVLEIRDEAWKHALLSVSPPFCFGENNAHIIPHVADDRRSLSSAPTLAVPSLALGDDVSPRPVSEISCTDENGPSVLFQCQRTKRSLFITRISPFAVSANSAMLRSEYYERTGRGLRLDLVFTVPSYYGPGEIELAMRFACSNFLNAEETLVRFSVQELINLTALCEINLRLTTWPRRIAFECMLSNPSLVCGTIAPRHFATLLNLIPRGEAPRLEAMADLMGIEPGGMFSIQVGSCDELNAEPRSISSDESTESSLQQRYVFILDAIHVTENNMALQVVSASENVQHLLARCSPRDALPANRIRPKGRTKADTGMRANRRAKYLEFLRTTTEQLRRFPDGDRFIARAEIIAIDERLAKVCGPAGHERYLSFSPDAATVSRFGGMTEASSETGDNGRVVLITGAEYVRRLLARREHLTNELKSMIE